MENGKRKKAIYVGAPACFALEQCCQQLRDAFGSDLTMCGCYLVGSALQREDWRDIDVRFIMEDEAFNKLFPDAGDRWEYDPRWLVMTVSISKWMSLITGLPIDFQFQKASHANKHHNGPRSALGLRNA